MKQVNVRLSEELAKRAKIRAIEREQSLQKYIEDLIRRDLGGPAPKKA